MSSKGFFGEIKRRNVYKSAVAYAIVGWLVIQVATQVFPFLQIPIWMTRLVIALVALGFPIALEERDGSNIAWINVDPLLASLHGNPRFEALVQKVIGEKK